MALGSEQGAGIWPILMLVLVGALVQFVHRLYHMSTLKKDKNNPDDSEERSRSRRRSSSRSRSRSRSRRPSSRRSLAGSRNDSSARLHDEEEKPTAKVEASSPKASPRLKRASNKPTKELKASLSKEYLDQFSTVEQSPEMDTAKFLQTQDSAMNMLSALGGGAGKVKTGVSKSTTGGNSKDKTAQKRLQESATAIGLEINPSNLRIGRKSVIACQSEVTDAVAQRLEEMLAVNEANAMFASSPVLLSWNVQANGHSVEVMAEVNI